MYTYFYQESSTSVKPYHVKTYQNKFGCETVFLEIKKKKKKLNLVTPILYQDDLHKKNLSIQLTFNEITVKQK